MMGHTTFKYKKTLTSKLSNYLEDKYATLTGVGDLTQLRFSTHYRWR